MFSRDELDKYDSFIVCRDDDADSTSKERFLLASNNVSRKEVTLSTDSSLSRLVERPNTGSFPETHFWITADKAFEMLKSQFISE